MQIKDSKYHKVWELEEKGNLIKVKLGDSKKEKDGNYKNCTWNAILVHHARDMGIEQGDTINIISGQVFQEKVGDKWYTNVTVFEAEIERKGEGKSKENSDFIPMDTDSVPF